MPLSGESSRRCTGARTQLHTRGMSTLDKLRSILQERAGLPPGALKENFFVRRGERRMRARQATTLTDYLDILRDDSSETKHLSRALSIHVSEFFRNPGLFERLRTLVLPGLFSFHGEVRILSLGCARGEETYSLALLVLGFFSEECGRRSVTICGADINEESLAKARTGLYTEKDVEKVPEPLRRDYIRREGAGRRIDDRVRHMVRFEKINIFSDVLPRGLNLILCRNVLMYITREEQGRIGRELCRSLKGGGYLVLGRSESLPGTVKTDFVIRDIRERIFQKIGGQPR